MITLFGRFRVETEDGVDVTPKGMKAQGLLAMLCVSDGYCRTRAWLQTMLWSDRSRRQASTSLRQSLSELRNRLGPDLRSVLIADRRNVQLDSDRISIHPAASDGSQEFLEGIDIQDPAFVDWLYAARHPALPGSPAPTTPPRQHADGSQDIAVVAANCENDFGRLFCDILASEISTLLRESYGLHPLPRTKIRPGSQPILITCHSAALQGNVLVSARAQDGLDGPEFWSGSRQLEARGAPPLKDLRVSQMMLECCEAVSEHVAAGRTFSNRASYAFALRQAKADIFSLDPVRVLEAEKTLASLSPNNADDTVLAWRLFLRVVLLMERLTDDPAATREEVDALVREAEKRPPNSLILAAVSYAQSMALMRIAESAETARRAIEHNPANPFAWFAASLVRVHLGDFKSSFHCILRARAIEQITPRRHWWDAIAAMAATAAGDLEMAKKLADTAHQLAPDFKVPMRYLLALHAREERLDQADAIRSKLQSVEADFSIERLLLDDAYPAATLRRTGVLSGSAISDLR